MESFSKLMVVLASTLALVGTAAAGGKGDNTKAQEESARAACLMGDYQTGTRILVDLFIQTGKSVHLFNQGRCYQQNHRWEEALDRFREFLRKADNLDESTRAYVDKHMAECESHLPKAAATPPPPAAPPTTAPMTETPSPVPAPASTPAPTPAVAKDSGSTLRIAGIVTAAVGVVGLGFGTYEYFRHESLVDDLKKKRDQYSDAQFSDKESQINNSKAMGWVSFGMGAAALIAGTTMYLLGRPSAGSGTENAAVALVPGISPGQTSLFLSGVF